MIDVKYVTDVGLQRQQNEDSVLYMENKFGNVLVGIADGMGGHNAGDVASQLAAKIVQERFRDIDDPKIDYKQFVVDVMLEANSEIYKQSLIESAYEKMGTTLSFVIYTTDNKIYIGHVGDSRIYYIDQEEIEQITKDHTLVQALIDQGNLNKEDEKYNKYKNVLLQALGTSNKVIIEVKVIQMPENFQLLICSDGLTGMITDPMIYHEMVSETNLETKVQRLVRKANELDGSDNISVIVLENRRLE